MYHMVLACQWRLVAPDIPTAEQHLLSIGLFLEMFSPPLYQRGFKVDPLDSMHPTVCIHCLIEPVGGGKKKTLRACLATVESGITDK